MCLPYVADSPNNLTNSPPPQCCDDVSAAFSSGAAFCLCYFVRRPNIFGFPLNSTKLLSLTSVCPMNDRSSDANFSLETLCSGSAALPPLQSITDPSDSKPPNFGGDSPPPPPFIDSPQEEPTGGSLTPEPADELPAKPNLSTIPPITSYATRRIYKLCWALLSFPLYVVTSV
ncbi:hypothetical protein BUALT_Bualt14G0095600 [Buddleja alternifolia]|uniref:Bifunctional inhibitor/plant lipid transfer protein/seed storage helical domain-containing protein n=1 Tax=Buddleja alternifolia TaxID=168488 RepID=A0AAV6WRQ3_9LAMI|nr:hypothetical protein BUALT_Bualt14G0095600 [Buddleja alternifolia]